jgi:hypothetical protein
MVTTRQTQAATTTLNASQIRRSVIFGRPHAHPSRKTTLTAPCSSRPSARLAQPKPKKLQNVMAITDCLPCSGNLKTAEEG